jgi:hypothetical protein
MGKKALEALIVVFLQEIYKRNLKVFQYFSGKNTKVLEAP